jgi:hypothetical protein
LSTSRTSTTPATPSASQRSTGKRKRPSIQPSAGRCNAKATVSQASPSARVAAAIVLPSTPTA